jgi:hypothetical protein
VRIEMHVRRPARMRGDEQFFDEGYGRHGPKLTKHRMMEI